MRLLVSLGFWAFLVLSSLAAFPFAVLVWACTAPFDRRRALLHRFTCMWACLYTWLSPVWRVEIRGRERIRRGETYVMVSNHLSLLDILVLFRLRTHFKWVSKIENFRVPLIGWNMRLNRYIKLVRGSRASVVDMMRACESALAAGSSILMFPEGTRSPDGHMGSFKTGAFELAKRTRATILPIALEGTAHALPKRGFVLRGRHAIRVTVLDAIPWREFRDLPPGDLARRVQAQISAAVEPDARAAAS